MKGDAKMKNEEELLKEINNIKQCVKDMSEQLNQQEKRIENLIKTEKSHCNYSCNEFSNKITSKLIENTENKIKTESEERKYQIDKLNSLTEYEKIILKNLESRIAILEEETEIYN